MLHGIKLEMLDKLNYLIQLSQKGRDNFPDEICNFLSQEFELQASVLFKVNKDASLLVLGKSSSARKNFVRGAKFNCQHCKNLQTQSEFSVNSDSNCEMQISEFVIYESCIIFKITAAEKGFIKIAKKTPFSSSDTDGIKTVSDFIGLVLKTWAESRSGGMSVSDVSFPDIIQKAVTELRAPANSIVGFTSILSEESLTSSQSEYLNTIKSNAQNFLVTVNEIIDLTKIENGSFSSNLKNINIKNLVHEVVSIYKQKSQSRNVSFELNIEDSLHKEIVLDEQKLRFVLNNILLLISSISFNGTVIINLTGSNNNINFTISSITARILEEHVNSIFTPFVLNNLDEIKSTNLSGMSMLLVSRYIKSMGGNISAALIPNSGLTFSFSFNYAGEKSINNVLSQIPLPTSLNSILVIEDDYATSKLMSNYLSKWGYKPTIVNNKEQTLALIQKEKFLAVILDIELPNTNGLELLKKINEHPNTRNTPVIVCSIEAEQQKAYLMGAVEYFVKPINYNYLVEILTSYKLRKNSNILCVDDDLPTLNLVKQAIETAGFNAIAEHISSNVINLIKDKQVDLAIVDLDMPHPNGFELIELLKSQSRFEHLPIIIYTGKENYQEDLKKIDGLFTTLLDKKSTNIEDLADTIEKMVNKADLPPAKDVVKKDDVVKILLAEDYKHSQIIVTRLLKKNGYENIVVVENGEEAYKLTKKEKFNLILMDMQMPIMNGFEATEQIRQIPDYSDTPIIALTAFAMKGDREKCLDAGATDYIPKPIDSKEFIEKVKYYTNS